VKGKVIRPIDEMLIKARQSHSNEEAGEKIVHNVDTHCKRARKSALPIFVLVAPPLHFPAFKVSAQKGLF
jgi:hypothetical protein